MITPMFDFLEEIPRAYRFNVGMWEEWVHQLIKFDCPLFMDVPNAMLFSYVNTESWPSLD